jgi:hypothetical protein
MRRLRISWLAREFRLDRQYLRQKTCARFSRIKAWRRPAPEIEALVLDGVRQQIASSKAEPALTDRELIERHVERVTIKSQAVEVYFVAPGGVAAVSSNAMAHAVQPPAKITLSWAAPGFAAVKGIVQAPSTKSTIKPESRDALLTAIAKARAWIDDIRLGHLASFSEIAERERQCERHIRLLAPLAFVSPRIIAAIAGGTAPAHLTVTGLAKALPYSWAEQESIRPDLRRRQVAAHTVGMSPMPSSFAASTLPWPAMMPLELSIKTGLIKPNSLILAAICLI